MSDVDPIVRRGKVVGHQARWRDLGGKQRKKSFLKPGATKRLAEDHLAQVRASLRAGTYIDERAGRTPLADYAEQWARSQPWRPATRRRIDSVIRTHIRGTDLGAMPLAAIRPSAVQSWATGLTATLAPSTTRAVVKVLRSVLLAAVHDRLIASTPAARITLPPVEMPRVVPLTTAQVRALADAMPERCRAMVVVQAGLGVRLGELLALRTQDVDFLRRSVKIEWQIRQHDRVRVPPKTGRSKRTVPLPQVVADALAAHIAAHPPGEDGTIFTTGSGRPWRQDYYGTRMFAKAVARAGIPAGTTSHDLRHAFVSTLLDAGMPLPQVAELVGDTLATVVEVYAHMVPGREERARAMIDAAWSAPDVPQGGESVL